MNYLDKLIKSTLNKELTPNKIASRLVARKLAELGVTLRDEQLESLERDIDLDQLDKITLDLDDEQTRQLESTRTEPSGNVTVRFTDQDVVDIENKVKNAIDVLIPQTISIASEAFLEAWKSEAPKLLAEQRTERSDFEKMIYERWGSALDLLETLISVCREAGSEFNWRFRPKATRKGDTVFDVLTRSHARACQVAFEILALLEAGFADGALARWRTLHEITVTAMFVAEHGNKLAERFLAHTGITDYHEAIQYQKHCLTLGYDPLTDEELDTLRTKKAKLLELYGDRFDFDYGWASEMLGITKPNFTHIEESVRLEHLRPFCKLANINVHAGSKSLIFRLGLPGESGDLLVAGPSLYGLADPGQNTAISVNQITATLLLTKPNLDRLAFLSATQALVDETMNEFVKAHQGLEKSMAG
jgi:hypothetical protein